MAVAEIGYSVKPRVAEAEARVAEAEVDPHQGTARRAGTERAGGAGERDP